MRENGKVLEEAGRTIKSGAVWAPVEKKRKKLRLGKIILDHSAVVRKFW